MEKKIWAYCPTRKCLNRQLHSQDETGRWRCENCGIWNELIFMAVVIQEQARKEEEKTETSNGQS